MASTYESPETVVISEAGPMVEAFKAFGDTVSTGIKRIGELRNKEAIANKKRQADLAKLAYVDSEAIFKRLQENKAGIALQNQALTLLNENAAYSASDAVDANQQKALTVKKLNGLIGYAADSELFKTNWIENQPSNIAGMTEQGGKSGLNKQYWDAANIFSGVEEGDVEISFDNNGLMFYSITGAGLEKPYKTPALDFLSRSLPEVPMWNDSVKQGLVQLNLIDESTGKLTTYARELSQEEYNKQSRGAVVAAISGYAKSSMQEVNSLGVEVFGNKDTYTEGRATGAIDNYTYNGVKYKLTNDEFNRSVIGMPEQEDLLNKALEFSFANVIPPHYGIDPKPLSTSEINRIKKKSLFEDNVKAFEDKFLRTLRSFEGGFNAAGVIKGGLNIFSKDKDGKVQIDKDDNKILNPKFVEALSYLGGYRVVSTPGEKEAVIKGDNGLDNFTVTDGQPINIFIENLHKKLFEGNSLYDANSAGRFAYQSDFINDNSSEDIKAQYKKFQTANRMN
tara:strand:+ start:248 stop:1774 length:1527 start_codon:yes stop_codon:yes gene_type:complete